MDLGQNKVPDQTGLDSTKTVEALIASALLPHWLTTHHHQVVQHSFSEGLSETSEKLRFCIAKQADFLFTKIRGGKKT